MPEGTCNEKKLRINSMQFLTLYLLFLMEGIFAINVTEQMLERQRGVIKSQEALIKALVFRSQVSKAHEVYLTTMNAAIQNESNSYSQSDLISNDLIQKAINCEANDDFTKFKVSLTTLAESIQKDMMVRSVKLYNKYWGSSWDSNEDVCEAGSH